MVYSFVKTFVNWPWLQSQLQIPLSNMTGVKYAIIFPYIGNILTIFCRRGPILLERPSQNKFATNTTLWNTIFRLDEQTPDDGIV